MQSTWHKNEPTRNRLGIKYLGCDMRLEFVTETGDENDFSLELLLKHKVQRCRQADCKIDLRNGDSQARIRNWVVGDNRSCCFIRVLCAEAAIGGQLEMGSMLVWRPELAPPSTLLHPHLAPPTHTSAGPLQLSLTRQSASSQTLL